MSNPTYGVDTAAIQVYFPQWNAGDAGDIHQTADVTELVEQQAAELNTLLKSRGIDFEAVAAATAEPSYKLARKIVTGCCLPYIVSAFEFGPLSGAGETLMEWSKAWLERFEKDPTIFGAAIAQDAGSFSSSVQWLGLSTTDEAVRDRRKWSEFGGAPGDPNTKKVHW